MSLYLTWVGRRVAQYLPYTALNRIGSSLCRAWRVDDACSCQNSSSTEYRMNAISSRKRAMF